MLVTTWPTVLGSDAAGVVVDVGSNFADKFQLGDRVFFQGVMGNDDQSTFQEYTRVPGHAVGKIPDNVSDEEAAGLNVAGVTAAMGTNDELDVVYLAIDKDQAQSKAVQIVQAVEPMYEAFGKWLASGELLPNRVQIVPGGLEGVDEGMDSNKKGVSGVKLVVKM